PPKWGAPPPGPGGPAAAPARRARARGSPAAPGDPAQRGARRVVVRQAGELGTVMLAYKAPAGLDPDADALDVLSQALSAGKSARLYRALTDEGLATSAHAYFPRLRDPGLFMLYATLAPDVAPETVEATLKQTLASVAEDGLTEAELARARRQVVAQEAFGRDGPYAVVSQLNEAIAVGDWTLFSTYPSRIEAVSAADVQAAAARLLDDDRLTVGWYVPTTDG
ncbi:MAG: insulinase family protein, partial [Bacteroidota bacterium]